MTLLDDPGHYHPALIACRRHRDSDMAAELRETLAEQLEKTAVLERETDQIIRWRMCCNSGGGGW